MLYSAKNIVRHRVCKTVGDLLYALRDIDARTELSSEMGGDYIVNIPTQNVHGVRRNCA
jgi:hypothetical protein